MQSDDFYFLVYLALKNEQGIWIEHLETAHQ